MTAMKIKTRFYFNDGDTLDTAATFEELYQNVDEGITDNQVFLVNDKSGRDHLVRWANVNYVENCYNKFDKLMEHIGEKSEVGIAADFVAKLPYGWDFPQTDYTKAVWNWLKTRQEFIPKEFQYIYIKIADTLLKEWDAEDVSGKVDFLREKASDFMGLDEMESTEYVPDDSYKLADSITEVAQFITDKIKELELKNDDLD